MSILSDAREVFDLLRSAVTGLLNHDEKIKRRVAANLQRLADTFKEFREPYEQNNLDRMMELASKTRGQLDQLKTLGALQSVLGEPQSKMLFDWIERVTNAKELASEGKGTKEHLQLIIKAAGYFEGQASVLKDSVL